jgi:ribosomal protein L37AE/L43A
MKNTQPPVHRCDRCGAACPVVRVDARNFDWQCPGCNAGRISWAGWADPPAFEEVTNG